MELTPDLRRGDPQNAQPANPGLAEWVSEGPRPSKGLGAPPLRPGKPHSGDAAVERGILWVLAASLVAHLCLFAGLAFLSPQRPDVERSRETPVEVVVAQPPAGPGPPDRAGSPPEAPKPVARSADKAPDAESAATKTPPPEQTKDKPAAAKSPETKAVDSRPEAKAAGQKPAVQKQAWSKPAEAEPRQTGSRQSRAAERKAAATKQAEARAADAQARPSDAGSHASAAAKAASAAHAATQSGDFGPRSGLQGGLRLPFDNGPPIFRAVAVPLPTEGGEEAMSYKMIVFGMLERSKQYPESARERGARGSAVVTFALDDSGDLVDVSLFRSSGDSDLDVESLALVSRAAPFPKPPPDAQRQFAAEITFGLERKE